jgi:Arc/MetJ family transcription regulator
MRDHRRPQGARRVLANDRAARIDELVNELAEQVYRPSDLYYAVCALMARYVKLRGRSYEILSATRAAVDDALVAFDDHVIQPEEAARERDPGQVSIREVFTR